MSQRPLSKLEPELLRSVGAGCALEVQDLAEAQGLMFDCPACLARHGPRGAHSVLVWFRGRGVPDAETPGPGRWSVSGSSLADITLSPSIDCTRKGSCIFHGWVERGQVRW